MYLSALVMSYGFAGAVLASGPWLMLFLARGETDPKLGGLQCGKPIKVAN